TIANISATANRLNIGAANTGALTVNVPTGANTISNPFALPAAAFTVTAAGTSTAGFPKIHGFSRYFGG
ncbi:MAG: hypothetical protein EBW80_03390, partial [Burkholderiaceae bacterium]|nr:hypothetical protein [Burkholderiaceae bacterium]